MTTGNVFRKGIFCEIKTHLNISVIYKTKLKRIKITHRWTFSLGPHFLIATEK